MTIDCFDNDYLRITLHIHNTPQPLKVKDQFLVTDVGPKMSRFITDFSFVTQSSTFCLKLLLSSRLYNTK